MSLTLRIEITVDELRAALERFRDRTIPAARQTAVREGMLAALEAAVDATPVDTGRARAAWVSDIEHLGGNPPPGWFGGQPSSAAINEGSAHGVVTQTETETTTEFAAGNAVPYVTLLEYGARGQPPRRMVDAGLRAAREVVPQALADGLGE